MRRKLIMPAGSTLTRIFDLPMFGTVSSDDHYTGHKGRGLRRHHNRDDFVPLGRPTRAERSASGDEARFDGDFKYSVDLWLEKSAKAAIDYSFHMNLTRFDEDIARQIPSLREMGITTLKVFTA